MQFDLGFVLFVIMIYFMVFSIVHRICNCIETCKLGETYAKWLKQSGVNKEDSNDEENS